MMKGAPGFLGAYFVAVDDTHGVSIEVFENEEQARVCRAPRRCRGSGRHAGHPPVRRGHRLSLTAGGERKARSTQPQIATECRSGTGNYREQSDLNGE